jgi:hypothetical protein
MLVVLGDVDADVLAKWRETQKEYLKARTALIRQVERQGWQAAGPATSYVDIVFAGPPGPEPPRYVEIEDEYGRSMRYGQWVEREDEVWVLRIPSVRESNAQPPPSVQ